MAKNKSGGGYSSRSSQEQLQSITTADKASAYKYAHKQLNWNMLLHKKLLIKSTTGKLDGKI